MRIYLCSDSADEYWYALRTAGVPSIDEFFPVSRDSAWQGIRPARVRSLDPIPPSDAAICSLLEKGLHGLRKPVHVCISSTERRVNTFVKKCHVWSAPVPYGAFVNASGGVYACTPEFMLLQLAQRTSKVELVQKCFEMCGGYALPTDRHDGSERCLPLSSVAMLKPFLDKVPEGTWGLQAARWAVRYAVDGSGSPMESIMVMLLCLPRTVGGYGLPLPVMNERIDVPYEKRRLLARSWVACDARWPSTGFCLEYDGRKYHRGDQNVERDYARANALHALGIETEICTIKIMRDEYAFDRLARRFAKSIGVRLRDRDLGKSWRAKHGDLRRLLIPSGTWSMPADPTC